MAQKKFRNIFHKQGNKLYYPCRQRHIQILLVILLIGIFFRFYNIPFKYGFDADPTRDGLISLYGAQSLQFPLIGPFSGIGNFTFGPWYYYQLILFTKVTGLPFAPWVYIGIVSVFFIIVMYHIGKTIKDTSLGLLLAFLSAVSPAQVGPTAGLSNPNLIPLHAGLSVLLFLYVMKGNGTTILAIVWGFIFGVGINNHFQILGLALLPIFAFLYKRMAGLRLAVFFVLGLLISFLPLLIFNLLTDWHTVTGFSSFLATDRNYVPNSWTIYLQDFWPQFWAYVIGEVPTVLGIGIGLFTALALGYAYIQKKLSLSFVLLLITFIINFIALRYYSGVREYYYLLYLHPLLFLFFGYAIYSTVRSKIGIALSLVILIVISLYAFQANNERMQSRSDFTSALTTAKQLQNDYPGEKFAIYQCKETKSPTQIRGIVYLLAIEHKIADSGIPIGINDSQCPITNNDKKTTNAESYTNFAMDTNKELIRKSWEKITPQSVYTTSLLWWQMSEIVPK